MKCPDCGKDAVEYERSVGKTDHYRCRACGIQICYTDGDNGGEQ
jgi:transposase-like protein